MNPITKVILGMALPFLLYACGPEETAETSSANDSLKIGSFNMLRLGHGSNKDYNRIAGIVTKARFDLLSAQEVMTEDGAKKVLEAINKRSNHEWKMLLSTQPTGESSYKEYFAVYYKSDLLRPKTRGNMFCKTGRAYAYAEGGCFAKDFRRVEEVPDFHRDPYVTQLMMGEHEIALVSNHLHFGSSSAEDIEQRKHEIMNVKKVMEALTTDAPDSTVVATGDFNLHLGNQADRGGRWAPEIPESVPEEFFDDEQRVVGFIDESTTLGRSSYDHFFVFEETYCVPDASTAKVYEADRVVSTEEKDSFRKEVSDHFPIGITLRCD